MWRLTRKMNTCSTKAMQSCGVDLVTVSKVKTHGEVLGADVARFVGRKHCLWAVLLMDRYVLNGSKQADAHCVLNFCALFRRVLCGGSLH